MAVVQKEIIFKFKNVKKTIKGIDRDIDRAFNFAVRQYAGEVEDRVIKEIRKMDAVASGRMVKGVQVNIRKAANKYVIKIFNRVDYMKFVDSGTVKHHAPIAPIKRWVAFKFGGDDRAAYAIRQSIAKKGTKAKPFLRLFLNQEKIRAVKVILRYARIYLRKT